MEHPRRGARSARRFPLFAALAFLIVLASLAAALVTGTGAAAADPAPGDSAPAAVPTAPSGNLGGTDQAQQPGAPQLSTADYNGAPWFKAGSVYRDNFPDPSVLRVGNSYYAYATNTGGPQLPVMTSTDLKTWTARPALSPNPSPDPYFNDALPVSPDYAWQDGWDSVNNRKVSRVWAPAAIQIGNQFVVYWAADCNAFGVKRDCIASASSSSPMGPFVPGPYGALVYSDARNMEVIDPQPFAAPDGQLYLMWRGPSPTSPQVVLWSQLLSPDGRTLAAGSAPVALLGADQAWEDDTIENPAMVYYGGRYLLFYSGNKWATANYATGWAVCAGPLGPCYRQGSPWLVSGGSRLGPGGTTPFIDANGGLRVAMHAWNPPFSNYPTLADNGADQACPEQGPMSNCPYRGQRLLSIDQVTVAGDGSLVDRPDPGAPVAPVSNQKFHPISPFRLLDSRDSYSHALKVQSGWIVPLTVMGRGGIPASGVNAVALNVTVANPASDGFVTVYPCGEPPPLASNNNYSAGQLQSNLVVAQTGTDGKVCLFVWRTTDLIVDLNGWYDSANSGTAFTAFSPTRLLDSRMGNQWTTPLAGGATRDLKVLGRGGVPNSSSVTAVALNVTAVNATTDTFLSVWGSGSAQPWSSTVNLDAGGTVPNLVLAPVGPNGSVSIYNYAGSVDVVADVVGYFSTSGTTLTTMTPTRVVDTRGNQGLTGPLVAGKAKSLSIRGGGAVPNDSRITGVLLSVTATNATAGSYLTVWPTGVAQPLASNLNFGPDQIVSNLVMVPLGSDGGIQIANGAQSTDVVVDVVGYYR